MKHKLLFILALLLAPHIATAQKLKAVSFAHMPGASVAQQRNIIDKKGSLCACIAVSCPLPDFTVEGSIVRQDAPTHGRVRVFVPQGTRWLKITAPGYPPLKVSFKSVNRNIAGVDSDVDYNLVIEKSDEKVPEYKPAGFSIGGSYVLGPLPGAALHVSGSYRSLEAELGYRFGTGYSGTANWFQTDGTATTLEGSAQYRLDAFHAKLGYILNPHYRLAVVPQAGYALHMLHARSDSKGWDAAKGDGCKLACLTVGVKLVYSPLKHISVFAAPEYDIALGKSDIYSRVAKAADFTAGGFHCPVGVLFHF